ncbi:hypothetical protein [Brevibacillus brevis]|uniref:hypothetical protein n=1 Tax=Brevibacillus brevis TaxID=1393 RepID=UPI0007D8B233|nr:hypothetical protein [Brevibacillus brevis]
MLSDEGMNIAVKYVPEFDPRKLNKFEKLGLWLLHEISTHKLVELYGLNIDEIYSIQEDIVDTLDKHLNK